MPYAVNDGVKIYYELTGSGPFLVLLHGIGSSGQVWHDIGAVERFAQDFTVVTIDGRGLGKSDRPSEMAAYQRFVRRDDTIAVLDDIGADRAHLVGYSMGGRNACYVAALQPERVASVVVSGANPYPMRVNLGLTADVRSPRVSQAPSPAPRPPSIPVRAVRKLVRILLRRSVAQPVPYMIRHADKVDFDVDSAAAAMTMPAFFLIAEFDTQFDVGLTREFAERLPASRFEIVPGEDHGMLRRLGPWLPKIEEFIAEASVPAN